MICCHVELLPYLDIPAPVLLPPALELEQLPFTLNTSEKAVTGDPEFSYILL
ncbi:hypothetical protein PILCRDRAFT_816211 [Piloderma croceum F 1598]|uniref:Uncharacterized protein n=1 Tax=Piloderma croceum (strain F 1598) TaxID=765440 RepID=A0A0C3G6G5_PILCF|nr:hypothetical protein PILCRDRAFT_816211 [Piloderma croceum F 1598]